MIDQPFFTSLMPGSKSIVPGSEELRERDVMKSRITCEATTGENESLRRMWSRRGQDGERRVGGLARVMAPCAAHQLRSLGCVPGSH